MAVFAEIITQIGCPRCEIAKEKLNKQGISYREIPAECLTGDFDEIAERVSSTELGALKKRVQEDVLPSLIADGIIDKGLNQIDLPIIRVMRDAQQTQWSQSVDTAISAAVKGELAEKKENEASRPGFAKAVQGLADGTIDPRAPRNWREVAPGSQEFVAERMGAIVKEAVAGIQAAGETDEETLRAAYVDAFKAFRYCAMTGRSSVGDMREVASSLAKCMGMAMALANQESLNRDIDQILDEQCGVIGEEANPLAPATFDAQFAERHLNELFERDCGFQAAAGDGPDKYLECFQNNLRREAGQIFAKLADGPVDERAMESFVGKFVAENGPALAAQPGLQSHQLPSRIAEAVVCESASARQGMGRMR